MQERDPRAPSPSWMQLVLCVSAVGGGAAAAAYLFWTVHWIAAVVIAVYLWILLTDVCVTGQQPFTWYLLDFLHHLLSFTGTAIITRYLWRFDWRIGTMAVVPIFILLLAITGFVILHLYPLTPAGRVAQDAQKQMEQQHEVSRL